MRMAPARLRARRAAFRPAIAAVAAALLLAGLGSLPGPAPARAASAEALAMTLTPWEGFVGVGGEQFGPVANPAGLAWLGEHALQAQYVSTAGEPAGAGARAVVYLEPDTGLGAGQLAYLSAGDDDGGLRQYVYSAAWRRSDAAFGFSVRHVTLDNVEPADAGVSQPVSGAAWVLDVGYRGQWARWLGVGVLARHALVSGDDEVRAAMPVEVAVGVAVELGLGLTAAADYIVPGVGNWEEAGWRYGLEGRFGRVLARLGQRVYPAGTVISYAGLGYLLESLRLDAAVSESGGRRLLSLGLSLYF